MAKCYAQKNMLTCDLAKGHEGPHCDKWILGAGGPAPCDRYVEWEQMEPVTQPDDKEQSNG